ncbi:hypothetical protein B0T22DRAFT_45426 [Podospora appendiculata]|uniref:Uncharacterized protein n=1 Tax=Podospora appendiculata TaxID=314037 RepID=A0AAE1CGD9_9PEZI|nr:hypothetical protein B0T22DRAFT_45426 [Podospora appendiculata]
MHNASSSHGNTRRPRRRSSKFGAHALDVIGQRLEGLSLISSTPTATQDSIIPEQEIITTPPNTVGQEKYMSLDTSLEHGLVASPVLMDDLMVDVDLADSMRMCLSSSPPSKKSTMDSNQPARNRSNDLLVPAPRGSGLRQKKKTRGSQVHDHGLEMNNGHSHLMIGLDDWSASWTDRFSLDANGNSSYPRALAEADLCELPIENRDFSDNFYGNNYRLESDWEMRNA